MTASTQRILTSTLVAALMAAAAPPVLGTDFPSDPALADYLAWARTSAPRVTGAAAVVAARTAHADGAGALPDLKLAWGEMIVPVETRVGPQQRVFSVSQSLPWFGTLGLRRSEAEARVSVAEARLSAVTLDLEEEIRTAWTTLAVAQAERALVADHLDLTRQIEAVTRAAYEADTAQYGQVLQAEMETGRLDSREVELDHRLVALTVRLNTLAGLDPGHPMPAAALDDAGSPVDHLSLTHLLDLMGVGNPDLQTLAHETAARQAAVDLAGKAGLPGLTFGVDYIMTGPAVQPDLPDSGKDPVIARVALAIPLWGGQAGARSRAAVGDLTASRSRLSAARLDLTAALSDAHARLQESRVRVGLYEDTLLPRARQALDVTRADYEAGRASFESLVAVRRDLLTLELDLLRARGAAIVARDRVVTLVGRPAAEQGDRS